jgi:acetyl-CoA carboxylase biotin carboxyl carrier protein
MADINVHSEITGMVWKILVKEGQGVEEDETLMILESMKMEIPLCATEDGTVKSINVEEGGQIAEGDVACVLEV